MKEYFQTPYMYDEYKSRHKDLGMMMLVIGLLIMIAKCFLGI